MCLVYTRPFEQSNESNEPVIHDNEFTETTDQTIVDEISNNTTNYPDDKSETLLDNGNNDDVNEEDCDFADAPDSMDEVRSKKIISTRKVNKRVDVKVKKRTKGKSKITTQWICRICDKVFSGRLYWYENSFVSVN